MSQNSTHDLKNNLSGGASILAGSSALSGTTPSNGTGVDCNDLSGPIHGIFSAGAATGSPDSFTATCKLQESDTIGSNYADIATQTSLVITAGSTFGIVRGIRTKRYVRCVATPAFVGGSGPALPVSANVVGQKQNY